MKCNQCDSYYAKWGSISAFVHEEGCPNTNKIYDKELEEWIFPPSDEEDDDEVYFYDEDRGGTGHGDISYSDADPGL